MTDDKALVRFNATRHGMLSRYTVLPWEDGDEYGAVLEALREEHGPRVPTEEHLVEELAGIIWRKRRLRLAEAATHRDGLRRTGVLQRHRLVGARPFARGRNDGRSPGGDPRHARRHEGGAARPKGRRGDDAAGAGADRSAPKRPLRGGA